MTFSNLEHLRRIDAHLSKLIDIAAKRTPGEWYSRRMMAHNASGEVVAKTSTLDFSQMQSEHNAAFIASCAGNAEAGWMATRAAIAEILAAHEVRYASWCLVCQELKQDPGLLQNYPLPPWADDILAAFPLESLK